MPPKELLKKLENFVDLDANDVNFISMSVWFIIIHCTNTLLCNMLPFTYQAECITIPQDGAWAKGTWYDYLCPAKYKEALHHWWNKDTDQVVVRWLIAKLSG